MSNFEHDILYVNVIVVNSIKKVHISLFVCVSWQIERKDVIIVSCYMIYNINLRHIYGIYVLAIQRGEVVKSRGTTCLYVVLSFFL